VDLQVQLYILFKGNFKIFFFFVTFFLLTFYCSALAGNFRQTFFFEDLEGYSAEAQVKDFLSGVCII